MFKHSVFVAVVFWSLSAHAEGQEPAGRDGGWSGPQRDVTRCFGIPATDPDVCSGNGDCIAPDICRCDDGWTGLECHFPTCFGVPTTDPEVCSGNGYCIAPDTCSCKTGWTGQRCQWAICFGQPGSDPEVCSGHGDCVEPDTCSCDSGWTGSECHIPICFGLPASDPDACSGHGTCIDPDTCSCDSAWTGPDCNEPFCGDGVIVGSEECDDGNDGSGDGCSSTCAIEFGCDCSGEPSTCACTPDPPVMPDEPGHQGRKHRYISVDPSSNGDRDIAYKVELAVMMRCSGDLRRTCSTDADCPNVCDNDSDTTCADDPACMGGTCVPTTPCIHHPDEGLTWWVQEPEQEPLGCRLSCGCTDEDWFARLSDTPYFRNWSNFGVADSSLLHISDCQIVPAATYAVTPCLPPTGDLCGLPMVIGTILRPPPGNYGDVVGSVDPVTIEFDPPNQILSVGDISGYLLTNLNYGLPGDPKPQAHWTWVDMEGQGAPFYRPQAILNVGDLNQILFGLMGRPYSWAGNNVDPGDCP